MNELEFRNRVYQNPKESDPEVLAAARENPAFQKILEQSRKLEGELSALVNSVDVPPDLQARLLAIPDYAASTGATGTSDNQTSANFFQYYAMAASLLLAIGVTLGVTLNRGPTAAELAMGNEVLHHVYLEELEIAAINSGTDATVLALTTINQAMAGAGTQLADTSFLRDNPVRYANPCEIFPQHRSAHMIIQGSTGAVSLIVIKNSPVAAEYKIHDARFNGVVVPMPAGNMILIGEAGENLEQYKGMFTDNLDWLI
jgi:hypothetical protein